MLQRSLIITAFIIVSFLAPTVFAAVPSDSMVLVEGGCFLMGNPDCMDGTAQNVAGILLADGLPKEVKVRSFFMARNEVTVGEFRRFVRESGYRPVSEKSGSFDVFISNWQLMKQVNWRNPGYPQTEISPVTCVNMVDAIEYCNWKSKKDGLATVYNNNGRFYDLNPSADGYRLPTEAEWEYAARERGLAHTLPWAGSEPVIDGRPAANVADETFRNIHPHYNDIWSGYKDGYVYTAPVGRLVPNALGIHDLIGNAAEWTWTDFEDSEHPLILHREGYSVVKGGSWFRPIALGRQSLSVSARLSTHPFLIFNDLGFRMVRNGD